VRELGFASNEMYPRPPTAPVLRYWPASNALGRQALEARRSAGSELGKRTIIGPAGMLAKFSTSNRRSRDRKGTFELSHQPRTYRFVVRPLPEGGESVRRHVGGGYILARFHLC